MTDEEAIRRYVADMKFRALLPGTIAVRERYLRKISREIGFADATEQKIIVWLSRDLSSKTRNMYLSVFAAFFTWALKGNDGKPVYPPNEDGTPFMPQSGIAKPRMHPRNPRPMPDDDLKMALACADERMSCFLLLGALAGMRCQEIAGLEAEDINEENNTIHVVHGKGDRERWVPLHPDVLVALKKLPMPKDGPLWDETPASMSRKINRFLHARGVKSTAHTLRHWYATQSYRASAGDIRLVQILLGHSSPATTAIYAAPDQSKASGVINMLSI